MAWRASYSLLLEIFPQVDARIIKAAALDHGDDLGSAADFILNEVLCPDDDGISDHEQHTVSGPESLPSEFLSRGPNAGDGSISGNLSDAECRTKILTSEFSESTNGNSVSYDKDGSRDGQEVITDLSGTCANRKILDVSSNEEGEGVLPVVSFGSSEIACINVHSRPIDVQKIEAQSQHFPDSEPEGEHQPRSNLGSSAEEEVHNSKDEPLSESSGEVNKVDAEMTGDETRNSLEMCASESTNMRVFSEIEVEKGNLDQVEEMSEIICVGSTYSEPENSNMEDSNLRECEELDEDMTRNSFYDSILVSRSKIENEAVVEEDALEMMTSTKISFDEEAETEGRYWETVSNTSTQVASMETLLDAVEQAKEDKEALISSIEELRALRHRTDQAECAARMAKEEAEKGGLDIMAQVAEMRKMLSLSREANEMHAAEVHGEKAVLATEARELRCRLVQLKSEKEKALSVLNEIKASLQARIEKACQERESAISGKAAKEALARECLMKEEGLMAKVAEESRELQTETETCNMLRDFLIERGNIVDALQGEVAVLCEDAEELKEEIERMSLSCSSGYVHMLKPRPFNDVNNSSLSRSGKSVVSGEGVAHYFEGVDQLDFPGDDAASSPARSVVAGQRNASDKRLPSLRRALSGSQDLSGSFLSSVNNSALSSRSVTKVSNDMGDGRTPPEDKYSSPRSSQCGSDTERKLYQAQIAMFPNEESDLLDYRTSNLDIFRTESSRPTKGAIKSSSDEDDWHLLDMTAGSKHTSSDSSCSSCVGRRQNGWDAES